MLAFEETSFSRQESDRDRMVVPGMNNLLQIAANAMRLPRPYFISSILGRPWTWLPPHGRFSEFTIIDPWRWRRTLKYLVNVTIPSLPHTPPSYGPPPLNELFWHPTVILQRPDHYGSYASFPDEAWFLVNGIMTNDDVAQLNAAYVSWLFHRPVTIIQNSPDSLLVDLVQCMIGKEWKQATEPARKAFPVIYDALKSKHKERVVVLAHSQGTIIMANVLRLLYEITEPAGLGAMAMTAVSEFAEPEVIYLDEAVDLNDFEKLTPAELAKLEVYNFATCANAMTYYTAGVPVPWIEHFGNENDIVARLGMQAPETEECQLQIDGPRYVRNGAWGHLLNAHYLSAIADVQRHGHRHGGTGTCAPYAPLPATENDQTACPRLYDYINGGKPPNAG